METSGVEPYSDEWMANNATHVSGVIWEAVRSISRGMYLESSAPNFIAGMIDAALKAHLHRKMKLVNGAVVAPYEIYFNTNGWHYRADVLSDDNDPGIIAFNDGDIDEYLDPIPFIRDTDGLLLKQK